MKSSQRGDAALTLTADELAGLRASMVAAEPNWPTVTAELARHLELLLPLVAGTVQGAEAEHVLGTYDRELDVWHELSDRYYAAFDQAERST